MRCLALCVVALVPMLASAETKEEIVRATIAEHIVPGFERLAAESTALAATAEEECDPLSGTLRDAYGAAFDAWMGVSHLRFGPTETENRAFALAFWPDTRGATPKALSALISDADPIVEDPSTFTTVSVAARGFYALEFLLYDPQIMDAGAQPYRCALLRAMTADIETITHAILEEWQTSHADALRAPGPGSPYRDTDEALRALYTSLVTGLEITADARLGRPLGTFERPRPRRAEVRRSERALRHVILSLTALQDLGLRLAALSDDEGAALGAAFDRALTQAERIDDPIFATVADPQGRFRLEVLQQRIHEIQETAGTVIGPTLGIAAGFNSLDGD